MLKVFNQPHPHTPQPAAHRAPAWHWQRGVLRLRATPAKMGV